MWTEDGSSQNNLYHKAVFPLIRLRSGCVPAAVRVRWICRSRMHLSVSLNTIFVRFLVRFYSIKIIKMAANTNGPNQALANGMQLACGPAGIGTCSDRKKNACGYVRLCVPRRSRIALMETLLLKWVVSGYYPDRSRNAAGTQPY